MILRPASFDDAASLAAFGRHAFVAAFGHCYASSDLEPFLEKAYGEPAVRGEIANPWVRIQLATQDDAIIGYCLMHLAAEWPEHARGQRPVTLHRLYVDPARTGQAIGTELMDWALCESRSHGADEVQLSVWSENSGAQRFYRRYGFEKVADIDFWVTSHRDDEFLFSLHPLPCAA